MLGQKDRFTQRDLVHRIYYCHATSAFHISPVWDLYAAVHSFRLSQLVTFSCRRQYHPKTSSGYDTPKSFHSHGWNSGTTGTVNCSNSKIGWRSRCRRLRLHPPNDIRLDLVRAEGKKKHLRIGLMRWSLRTEWICLTKMNVECGYWGKDLLYLDVH